MEAWIRKKLIRNAEQVEDPAVRTAYGQYAGGVGIFFNLILFGLKMFAGLLSHSSSIIADAVNNLSDAATSVISAVGMRLAGKPADKEHPFGHGRIEYIAAFIVSMCIFQVGFGFFKEAIEKIKHPEALHFRPIFLLILIISVLVKLYLAIFYRRIGGLLNASSISASAADSLFDVISTGMTGLSLCAYTFFDVNIDGIVTLLVALFVLWGGLGVAREVISSLIGNRVPKNQYQQIESMLRSSPGVVGIHDLIIHNYGPGHSMATAHIEVPEHLELVEAHAIAAEAERRIKEAFDTEIVIHIDPSQLGDRRVRNLFLRAQKMAEVVDQRLSIHDFHCEMEEDGTIYEIQFALAVPLDIKDADATVEKVQTLLETLVPDAVIQIKADPKLQ